MQLYPTENEPTEWMPPFPRIVEEKEEKKEEKPVEAVVKARPDDRGRMVLSFDPQSVDDKIKKVEREATIIYNISAVFPFDFFPNQIIVHENRVDVIYNLFFYSRKIFPMLIRDLNGVTLATGPLFAAIDFEIKGYETNPEPVRFLRKAEAVQAHRIISGLIVASKNNIDLSRLSPNEVRTKAQELGTVQT
jgi:hypothetical protein